MYYVGIDIAKRTHVACVMDEANQLVYKPFAFDNSLEGFKKLLEKLQSLDCDISEVLIGMEATGMLFENLYRHLRSLSYRVVLLNPYQTSKYREMDTMKRIKTDNIDAKTIAALLKSGRYRDGYVNEDQLQSLRMLFRHKAMLEDQRKAIKRKVSGLLAVVFPEFERVIKDPFSATGMALLAKYPTAKHYAYASEERILKLFRNIKGNAMNRQKARALLDAAKESVYSGEGREGHAFVMQSCIETIQALDDAIAKSEAAMLALFDTSTPPSQEDVREVGEIIDNLRTVPGVGDRTILAVLAECGPLDRFHNAKALVGYLGLYPTKEQSGDTLKNGKLAKRGAKLAKKALYLAAIAAVRHNDELRQIYHNYRSKGRAKKECLIIVARKLVAILFAIYKYNVPYDPNRVFVAKPNP